MARTERFQDPNTAGGYVVSIPQGTVYVNGLLASVDGSLVSPDAECHDNNVHCSPDTANGGPTVFVEGIPLNKAGDLDTCGHPRDAGSPDVFNDSFQGAGALIDSNPPYHKDPPTGGQPTPPDAYVTNTAADVHVIENNDDPDGTLAGPPELTDTKPVEKKEEEDKPVDKETPVLNCSSIEQLPSDYSWDDDGAPSFETWARNFQLSPRFTVYDLTMGTAVSSYTFTTAPIQACGLSQKQILQNLCYLAKSVLEPLVDKFGSFTLTSVFRNKSDKSQHNKGQAADIQFLNFHGSSDTGKYYFERAKEIRDSIQFDQLILEWFGRNPWIHISSNSSGNRGSVLTQTGSSSYSPGLMRLG